MRSNDAFAVHFKWGHRDGLAVYELQPDESLKDSWSVAGQAGNGDMAQSRR
jgi:hypothetical protein